MLALNSRRPENVRDTSAGVSTMTTFREPVRVRVNDEDSLEIVFAQDPGKKNLKYRNVGANERYS